MTNSAMFLGEPGGGHLLAAAAQQQQVPTVGGSTAAFSDLTCRNNNNRGCFVTRRVGDGLIMEGHGGALLPQAFAPAGDASTSGRATPTAAAPISHGLLSHLYRHSVEADALIRIEVSEFGSSDHQPVMLLCSVLAVKNGV
jgi:E3 ubiquitin-protein ligase BOI and related proteins